ncbi:MAG TPA: nitroreductase family protein, partial [Candidatus Eisenbacteria bacterium]|nr:nitroreductase family protein [Candidatus Eisenbacteria bacterium]
MLSSLVVLAMLGATASAPSTAPDLVPLPPPQPRGQLSLEEAIAARRSVREFRPDPLTAEQLSQLFWAMQGVTSAAGQRAAPSAGALYPLDTYVATGDGLFHYEPAGHRLTRRSRVDLRSDLGRAAHGQATV